MTCKCFTCTHKDPRLKSRTENVQPPCVRLYTCSDGVVFDNEDMAKSHEANLKSKQSKMKGE